jgi:hypothetical protein
MRRRRPSIVELNGCGEVCMWSTKASRSTGPTMRSVPWDGTVVASGGHKVVDSDAVAGSYGVATRHNVAASPVTRFASGSAAAVAWATMAATCPLGERPGPSSAQVVTISVDFSTMTLLRWSIATSIKR